MSKVLVLGATGSVARVAIDLFLDVQSSLGVSKPE
jgi:NADPH:quinone reductase-like Zn-dependent oxidoreductase